MKNMRIIFMLILIASLGSANADTVVEVYSCGNDVGIKTQENGWLVVRESEVGAEKVNRILSIALTLLSTQKPIGYYNAAVAISWCGIPDVKPFNVLAIRNN